jgi:pyrroline-5-carboxylate reductase
MGVALMKGAAKIIGGNIIGFTDIDEGKARAAAREIGGKVYESNTQAVLEGDLVFLAVKPQTLRSVLGEISPAVKGRAGSGKPAVLVSMVAGWTIAGIQEALRGSVWNENPLVVRIMPNQPALIGEGVIALCASHEVRGETIAALERILSGAGIVDRIDEEYFNAVTGLSGSGPGFAYLFIEALADGGVRAGLSRERSLRYAVQTVLGAAAMVKETGRNPGELKDMVASPSGTTIEGIAALEAGAFRGTVMSAVQAAHHWARRVAHPHPPSGDSAF